MCLRREDKVDDAKGRCRARAFVYLRWWEPFAVFAGEAFSPLDHGAHAALGLYLTPADTQKNRTERFFNEMITPVY